MLRICLSALCCLSAILAVGCGKASAPDYDRSGNLELRELIAALDDRDYEQARRQLERLQAATPDSVHVNELWRVAREGTAIRQANTALADGKPEVALARIEDEIDAAGASDRLRRARRILRHLLALEKYRHTETETAREALIAVAALPPPDSFPGTDAGYAAWRARQEDKARERVRAETARLAIELQQELDLALVRGDPRAPLILARLGIVAPGSATWQAWYVWARTGDLPATGTDAMAADIVRFLADKPAGGTPPASFCGRYGRTIDQLGTGSLVDALAQLRQLRETLPDLDGARARNALARRKAPPDDRGPAVTDLLQALFK